MKKIIFAGAFFTLVAGVIIGCKKQPLKLKNEISDNSNNEFKSKATGYYTDGTILIFTSASEYDKVVTDPTDLDRKSFLDEVSLMSHTTYGEHLIISSEKDVIGDEYFNQILNKDRIVQIGDYLYRINAKDNFVFALPALYKSSYNDLVNESTSNKHIRKFSTEDDVIELVEAGEVVMKGLFCKENQASNPQWSNITYSSYEPYTYNVANSNHTYVIRYKRECKMNYLKLGIYYNLQAKLEVTGNVSKSASSKGTYGVSGFNTEGAVAIINSKRIYKIRCQSETGWNSVTSTLTNGSNIHKAEYNSYRGSKGLKKYWIKCGFKYQVFPSGNVVSVYADNLIGETLYQREIRSGY